MRISKHLADEQGQLLVVAAVTMVGLLGFVALTIDGGYMYAKRNRLYAAADAAAKSAAFEIHRNSGLTLTELQRFADEEVRSHGFNPVACASTGGAQVCLTRPAPGYSSSFVQAEVKEETNTFFGRVLGWVSGVPGARAIAGVGNPSNCLVTNQDLELGNTQITLNNCGVGVGGNILPDNPNSEINGTPTPPVNVSGACAGSKPSSCPQLGDLTLGAPSPIDPLANLAQPDPTVLAPGYPGTCTIGSAATIGPGCYTKIESTVLTMTAGDYVVTGTVNIGNLTGNGVFIFLVGGAARMQAGNNQDIHLVARSTTSAGDPTGQYIGIAIFQDRSNINNWTTGNNFTMDINGAVYMPTVDVDFPNSLSFVQTGCTLFIAKSLAIRNGSGNMSNSGCAGSFGGAAFLSVVVVE